MGNLIKVTAMVRCFAKPIVCAFTIGSLLTAAYFFPSHADDATSGNIVEQLQSQLDSGKAQLAYQAGGHGYLEALLKAFHISVDSQLLVLSASSLQFDRIGPATPRALYYQDNVAVGSVQNGRLIEIITTDQDGSVAYYTLDVAQTDRPRFQRQGSECVICHGYASKWAPGMIVADTAPGPDGLLLNVDPGHPFRFTDDRTPFQDRYGGWYVTGETGTMKHRGNVTFDASDPSVLPNGGLNIANLNGRVDLSNYLDTGSDIVSLLTLEHQVGFANLIARINAQYRFLNNQEVAPELRTTAKDIDVSIEALVAYMTFADEVPLPSPVAGSSTFSKTFAAKGPTDGKGRSLRQFDLKTRIFRYPLSYMIYSQAFDDLNRDAKDRLWRRLFDVLRGTDHSAAFESIQSRERAAAINIVAATKLGVPDYWKGVPEP
jgi:hypothetical protein